MPRIDDLTPHLDPELREPFSVLPAVDLARITDFAAVRAARRIRRTPAPDGVSIVDGEVPGAAGDPDVPVRVYRPTNAGGPANVLVWIHGGGFVFGDVDANDPICIGWVKETGCSVVSVEYRLAPEHPFPAAPNDCYAALEWVATGPDALGGIPAKVAVGGASAGGCIAAAVVLMARDRNGPAICHQHLLIPVIDDRLETPSAQRIHDPRVWNRANADAAWRLYLGPTHTGTPSPYAAPGRAEDLSGLPPATVLVEEMDLLRDEAVAYAGRLTAAGVRCELHVYPGTFHGHMAFVPGAAISRRSIRDFIDAVGRSFA